MKTCTEEEANTTAERVKTIMAEHAVNFDKAYNIYIKERNDSSLAPQSQDNQEAVRSATGGTEEVS